MPRKAASSTIGSGGAQLPARAGDSKGEKADVRAPRRGAESAGNPAAVDDTGAVLDTERSVVVLLATIANQIGASGSITYQTRHGLSSAEWRIFALVAARPHVCGMELAQFLSIDKASVSRTIRTLGDRDLIHVERSELNRNQQALTLTARGRRLHAEAIETAFERERCLLSVLSEEERSVLAGLLRRIGDQVPSLFKLADQPAAPVSDSSRRQLPVPQPAAERVARLERGLAALLADLAILRREIAASPAPGDGADEKRERTTGEK